jgi:flagellar basal-body rod modification protein FlgD
MTISGTGASTETVESQFYDATRANSLGKDDFLMLLVTQLRNQDPLQPMENTEFVAQLAQFSSLEQLTNIGDQLALVEIGQMSVSNMQAASLVGREITARGDTFSYDGTGGTDLEFELSGNAERVEIVITDEHGAEVRTLELGPQSSGMVSEHWDGRTDSGTFAGAGRYQMQIRAFDGEDTPVETSTLFTGTVTGIFFDRGYAELEVDGARIRLGDVVSIGTPAGAPEAGGDAG